SPLVGLKGQYNVMPYLTVIVITAILIVLLQFLYFKKYQRI
ncbi:MAG: Bcr/CflA family drug resistance efflux transporter, partial [Staphylococcus sp.]|nr:Bcr/CflA family drug resistance efflux transporter [Staphylococcus sp.]